MAVDVLKLKQRLEVLRSDRSVEETVWDELEKFIMPLTGQVAQAIQGSSVQQKTDLQLWDLTAPLAAEHLASSLHGDLTSPAAKWLDLEWQDAELEGDHESIKYREKLAELAWSELQASDFGMEIASGYLEWGVKGNMSLVTEPMTDRPGEWKGLDFTAVPIAQVWFEEDSRGRVARWWRQLMWTASQIVDHCERDTDANGQVRRPAPERIRKLAEDPKSATTKIAVIFCIFRRDGSFGTEALPAEIEGDAVGEQRPYGYVYFTLDQTEQLGGEGGYYKMPVVQGRWGKRAGTPWGYGRGHIALRHVKYLNAFKELARNAAEKAVDPAHGVSERVGGPVDLRPGKTTVMPGKDDWWPLEGGQRFDVSVEVLRDERVEIRRAFHEDDLQLKESPQMTATEVQARKDQMNRALGSPVARLQTDVLEPVVEIVIDHLSRAKRLPPAPELVKKKKAQLKLRLRGPIARAQLMDQVVAIERVLANIANLVKLGLPQARHYVDLGASIREHAKLLGAPAVMLVPQAKAQAAIDQENQAAQRAMEAKTAKDMGQAAAAASGAMAPPAGGGMAGIGEQPALVPSGGVPA